MKKSRQEAIISIIESREIGTQEELMNILIEMGFKVTQATVSRDIKSLKLIKTPIANGQYRYTCALSDSEDNSDKFLSILNHSIVKVDHAGNMAVVKCFSGMAQATCTAVDALFEDKVVGTIAGDDTIFILCRTEELAVSVISSIEEAIK